MSLPRVRTTGVHQVSIVILLVISLAAILAAIADAAPIRIAYSSISGAMLPLWVAKDKKLFEKHGVDVELTYVRGVSIEALLAGEVQFCPCLAAGGRALHDARR